MDKTTNWLIRIATLVVIGAGVTYLFKPEIGSLNPENRERQKIERATQKALEIQAEEMKKIREAYEEEKRIRSTIACLECEKPEYPKQALIEGMTGVVSIKVFINKDGSVSNAILKSSSGYALLDDAALDAARRSTFNPIEKDSDLVIKYDMRIPNK